MTRTKSVTSAVIVVDILERGLRAVYSESGRMRQDNIGSFLRLLVDAPLPVPVQPLPPDIFTAKIETTVVTEHICEGRSRFENFLRRFLRS